MSRNTENPSEELILRKQAEKIEKLERNLEIEAALERVRGASMAMHESKDLHKVIVTVYNQLVSLGLTIHSAQISDSLHDKKTMHCWIAANGQIYPMQTHIPYTRNAFFTRFKSAISNGDSFYTQSLSKRQKDDFFQNYFENSSHPDVPQSRKEFIFSCPGIELTAVMGKDSALSVMRYDGIPFRSDENDIIRRFAKVFEQSHSRFLDLQKAEKQAREAQIETALERIRSRSMAMHRSDELKDVIQVVYQQFVHLNINVEHTGFIIDYNTRDDMNIWLADENAVFPEVIIPYFDCAHWNSFIDAKENGKDFFANQLAFEEKNKFYRDLFEFIPGIPEETKEYYLKCPALAISTVLLENIGLYIENFSGIPYTDDENKTLMRFGKVFQQTYTRFLDLQKAEAQAREAQIEAALERVRSRSMAMRDSVELADLSFELVKQVQALGVPTWFCAFNIYDEDSKGSIEWGSNGEGVFPNYRTPREGIFLRYYEVGQKGESLLINEIGEKECPAHYEYLCTLPGVGEQLLKMKDAGIPFPKSQIDHVAYFKYGYVLFITFDPAPDCHNIFIRFAKVFEQTYTRFLDLQKAEAQTREAQVENALEKVRSRTMAMQNSGELPEVANVLFLEVRSLGIPTWSAGYNILSEDRKSSTCIMSSEGQIQSAFQLPLNEEQSFKQWHQAIINDEELFVQELVGESIERHYEYLMSLPGIQDAVDPLEEAGISFPTYQVNHLSFFHHGFLLFITYEQVPDAHEIFRRFSQVFEQTYTRFLDLEKAELQTREAKIEAALERTRTQSMLMQHSQQ